MRRKSMKQIAALMAAAMGMNLVSCAQKPELSKDAKPATRYTSELNQAWYDMLDFSDHTEKENAERGLIEAPENLVIDRDDGATAWDLTAFDFVKEKEAPDTVNPSLWRHTQLNACAGLFEVVDGIYQVRGYDMANATFIRTDNGWIVFDVLMCQENMAAAKELMEKHFGPLDIKAVLYSHSHIDHYGGIYGLIREEDAADASLPLEEQLASGKTAVLAPDGFLEHAISENLFAGPAMGRRAQYQYGSIMKPGERERLAIGIGLGQSVGTIGLLAPTYVVKSNETLNIDGLEIHFQLTPGTEAPAEMNAWFPKYKGLWMAENCTGTMHNIYTLRGAQVRDAVAWAAYILEAETMFGDEAEVVFQSHNWPHWGNDEIRRYMEDTAAVYQYINNQTLHYINQGMTADEISRTLVLPDRLNKVWYCRQYYGTLSHNIKAVYQRYMGWYDANPVNLNPMTAKDTAEKWVEYLGDIDAVLDKAQADFERGEYQWVAQLTKELVFADPTNERARKLCADALEQLGYQSESGPWRNVYLMGAWELREGNQSMNEATARGRETMLRSMTMDMLFDYIDIMTDALAAQNDDLSMEINTTDTGESFHVLRRDGVLLVYSGNTEAEVECTVTCTRPQMIGLMAGNMDAADKMQIEGDATALGRLFKYMTKPDRSFNIIEPNIKTAATTTVEPNRKTAATTTVEQSTDGTALTAGDEEVWTEIRKAYIYFLPLVLMDHTKTVGTNTVKAENGKAPVNQIGHGRNLATAEFKQVVTPNVDTVYSQIFYDLGEDALVLTKPATDRYNTFQIMDAWSDTVAVVGTGSDTADEQKYLLTGPGFRGQVPDGMKRIEVPTAIGWIIGRTVCNGKDDLENIYAIQDKMDARPLRCYLRDEELPSGTFDQAAEGVPIQMTLRMKPKEFFDRVNVLLENNPGYKEDKDILAGFEKLGIGAGRTFDPSILGTDIEEQWSAMLKELVPTLTQSAQKFIVKNGAFSFLGDPISRFGTEYDYRGLVAIAGFGANPVDVAVYMKAADDDIGEALSGQNAYVLHFEADQLPPVKENGFWSITAYGDDDFLIDNPIDRYAINDRSPYKLNEDGTLDILLQADVPEGDGSNWLPVGTGNFHLFLRIYLPEKNVQDGIWKAPTLTQLK